MKKRLLTALMAVCLVFALGTVTALADDGDVAQVGDNTYATLQKAIDAAELLAAEQDSVTITLLNNVEEGQVTFDASGTYVLDLNTYSITSSDDDIIEIRSGNLSLTVQNGTLNGTSAGTYGIYAYSLSGSVGYDNIDIVLNSVTINCKDQALGVQGLNSNNNLTMTNCKVDCDSTAIYFPPKSGKLTINNSVITGVDNAIVVKGGEVVINGDETKITATGERGNPDEEYTGDPNHPETFPTTGAAIYVEGGYERPMSVTVNGGTIDSNNGDSVMVKFTDDVSKQEVYVLGGVLEKGVTNMGYKGITISDAIVNGQVINSATGTVKIIDSTVESIYGDNISVVRSEVGGEYVEASDGVVASVGNDVFSTLQEAISLAPSGSTVVLLSNVEEHITVPASANIKLDLNGKTIDGGTGNGTATIRNEGTLVIKDSAGGGTIKRSDDGAIPPNSYYVIDNYTGTLTFESGSVYNNSGDGVNGSSLIRNIGTETKSATLNINGGTFRQDNFIAIKNDDYGILNVNGGTIISENDQAIQNWNTAEITDGNITGQVITWSYTTVPNNAKMTISGGYIDGPVNSINYYEGDQYATTAPEVIITGDAYVTGSLGTYTHKDGITTPTTDANDELAKITVNGGTFEQPAVKYLADNLNYEVKTGGTPATYTYYSDATTAAANAPMGSTITYLGSTTGVQTYTVTFVYYNGYQTAMTVPAGTEITLPGATRANYTFDGWKYTGGTLSANTRFQVNGNVTFTAVWKDGQYDIVIDDGMKFGDVIASVSSADLNDTVTLYVRPDLGFKLDEIKVTYKSGLTTKTVALTYVLENTYTFKMPAADVLVTATFKADGMPFVDVSRNQWFYDAVYYVWSNGVMEGVSTYYFYPGDTMTRAMFWTVLARIDGESITGPNWVSEARAWAMANGVSDGTDPYGKVTREQMVTMLWRYIGEPNGTASLSGYTDAGTVSGWAEEAMRWAIGRGVINGMTNTTLEPRGDATRAQCATIFMRYMKLA